MRFPSPLRYPGGKGALTKFLDDVIHLNDLQGCRYFEPYAGGAGAALGLLISGAVSEINLNDADLRVYAFWQSLLSDWERFAEKIWQTPITMEEWQRQREVSLYPAKFDFFQVGFSTFFLNRCNRSGIISGGPIGGGKQDGKWRLDVRFNREELSRRVQYIGGLSHKITIKNLDAIDFLKKTLPRGKGRGKVFVYLDPPYVLKARKLYMNIYKRRDHEGLSKYILGQKKLNWVISYDDCQTIKDLYSGNCNLSKIPIRYSLQKKQFSNELLVYPSKIRMPIKISRGEKEYLIEPLSPGVLDGNRKSNKTLPD